jgi:hypothetical protein
MRLYLFILLAVILFPNKGMLQSFQIIIDKDSTEIGTKTVEIGSGNYLSYGIIKNKSTEKCSPLIVTYTSSMDTQVMSFPKIDTSYYFLNCITKENGNFLFFGRMKDLSLSSLFNTIYICEFTSDFSLLWEKFYTVPEGYDYRPFDFLVDEDNNIILFSGLNTPPYTNTYLYLTKFNMEGDLLLEKLFPNYMVSMYNDIIPKQNPDEGYLILGEVRKNYLAGDLLELDKDFNISTPWVNTPFDGENYLSPPLTAKWLSNGNLFLVHRGKDVENAEFRLCNPDYTTLKDTAIIDPYIDYTPVRQGMDFIYEDLIWTATFNMYLQPISYDKIFRVYVYDSEMNMIGMKTYGGDSQWWLEHLLATSDGGCIITGAEREADGTQWDDLNLYIIKIMPDDIFTAAEDTPMENDRDVALYPNPVQDYLHIETARKNLNIRIMDNLGRIVHQQKIRSLPHDKANLNTLTKGVYFYQILDDHRVIQNGKLMKQ